MIHRYHSTYLSCPFGASWRQIATATVLVPQSVAKAAFVPYFFTLHSSLFTITFKIGPTNLVKSEK